MSKTIRSLATSSTTVLSAVLILSSATVATAENWIAGSGGWSTPGNWSPATVPIGGDDVTITPSDGAAHIITYDYTGVPVALGALTIDLTGAGANRTTLIMSANNLTTVGFLLGSSGRATINQSGGNVTTNDAGLDSVIGHLATGNGIYNLSGTGALSVARDLYVGNLGVGVFNQSGGMNTIGATLRLGNAAGSNGTYTLSNSAALTASDAVVGNSGTGALNINDQSSVHVNSLTIGSLGSVNLNGGKLRFGSIGGLSGLSGLTFNSGTVQLTGSHIFGGADATINSLIGAVPTIPANKTLILESLIVNHEINSTFSINGGTLTSNSGLELRIAASTTGALNVSGGGKVTHGGDLTIGHSTTGSATVSGAGSNLTVAGDMLVSLSGAGTLNVQSGGSALADNLQIGGTGTVNLNGGTFRFNGYTRNPGGVFNYTSGTIQLAGNRTLNADAVVGEFYGAAPTIPANKGLTVEGTATMAGTTTVNGSLTANDAVVGNLATDVLNINSQSTVYLNNSLTIGSLGSVNLNGGTLRFQTASGLNRLNFVSGTVALSGVRLLDSDGGVQALFGSPPAPSSITIPSGKHLHVEASARIESGKTVTVSGGTISSPTLIAGSLPSGSGTLVVTNGGTVMTTTNATIGQLGSGTATTTGAGSTWTITNDLTLGNGPGTLNILDQSLVHVGNAVLITGSSNTVNLQGGTLRFNTCNALDRISFTSGTIQLAGGRTIGSDATITTLFGTLPAVPTGKGLTVEGTATLVKHLTIDGGAFKANSLVIGAGGALDFDRGLLEISGGTISGLSSLVVPTNGEFRASGVQAFRVTGAAGSAITATGNLTLGSAAAVNGFGTQGTLQIGANSVTLLDANDVVFDSLSLAALGSGASPGTLNAANGLTLDFGGNITGFGTISTPNVPAKPLINNGHVTGTSGAQRITLPGYVKGVGAFDNVNFTGTFSPGLSPTILPVGNIALSDTSTLVMEIGGTAAGSGYDLIQSTGALTFDGMLQVSFINGFTPSSGQSFNLFDWITATGTFDTLALPTLAGLAWNTSQLYTTGVISLAAAGLAGDYNQNGTVDAADYTVWRNNLGSGTSLPNDDTAGVGPDDYTRWKTHFGETAGSGASALGSAEVSAAAVPEPTTIWLVLVSVAVLVLRRQQKLAT